MDKNKSYLSLKKAALSLGADLFGVADVSAVKKEFALSKISIERFDKAIVLAVRLSQAILDEVEEYPTRLYFHHYRNVNAMLDHMAVRLSNIIQAKGKSAMPIPASSIVDWQNQKAHLSHKKMAHLAGLGWIGRNNLLVNAKLGCSLRLVTILTDLPLKTDKPVKEGCGSCKACLSLCPCGAIKEDPSEFDHLKCFEKLKEFQKMHYVEQYICGICVRCCKGSA